MLTKEAKVTLFAVVSFAVLVAVLWYHERSLRRMDQIINPVERASTNDPPLPERVVIQPEDTPPPDEPIPPIDFPHDDPVDDPVEHPGPDGRQPGDDAIPPPPPAETVHEVLPGETLWDISVRYFGNGGYADAIFQHNRDRMAAPDYVVAGLMLRIPKVDGTIVQAPPDDPVVDDPPPPDDPIVDDPPPPNDPRIVHEVQPNESLWAISVKYFGDASRVQDIFNANRDKLTSRDNVAAGMKLVIPQAVEHAPRVEPPAPVPVPDPIVPPLPPVPPIAPPDTRIVHVVQPGENLWTISRKYAGDATHRNAIFEANRDKLKTPDRVRAGMKLVIPHVERREPAPVPIIAPTPPAPPIAPAPRSIVHVVQPGETLITISVKYAGNASRFKAIFEANRDKLKTPDRVRAGMKLVIPVAPRVTPAPAHRPAAAALRKHTVMPGESIERIARKYFPGGTGADNIIAANRLKLRNPNIVRIGTVLDIPADQPKRR